VAVKPVRSCRFFAQKRALTVHGLNEIEITVIGVEKLVKIQNFNGVGCTAVFHTNTSRADNLLATVIAFFCTKKIAIFGKKEF